MEHRIYWALMLLLACVPAAAQTITFDTDDYKAVGVYDSWEGSPFRTGELAGNAQVIDNHLTGVSDVLGYAPNTTAKVAAVQRSRYGGNLFGLRVDLNESFRLTKEERYVHVMMNRPVSDSRTMLITLGKRSERASQSQEVEQTWSLSSTTVGQDGWYDAVFAIKGFSYDDTSLDGIDIYSLVICPDVTDRSTAAEDFAVYIDQIVIDDVPTARFNADYYAVSFDKDTEVSRTDRYLNSVSLTTASQGTQTYSGLQDYLYNDGTATPLIVYARAGESAQPLFNYTGQWMDGYVYVDWGNDGSFSYGIADDATPASGTDLVSYNGYMVGSTWYNSLGETVSNGNQIANGVPPFAIAEDTPAGLYRMRYKVDWNSLDPAGNTNTSNLITDNGGAIVDVLLNVMGSTCTVNASQLNGDILPAADLGTPLSDYRATCGEALKIKVVPADGFTYSGIRVRYGYNLSGDSLVYGNPQYFDAYYTIDQFNQDVLTLPASIMSMGQVQIEGYMVEGEHVSRVDSTADVPLTVHSQHGRIIARQAYVGGELSYSTGVPEEVTAFKFLGLVAQPLVDGYECATVTIRHGWDDTATEWTMELPDNGRINIPKDSVYGQLTVTADFVAAGEQTFTPAFIDEFDELDDERWTTRSRGTSVWNRFISTDPSVCYVEDGHLVCRCLANPDTSIDDAPMLSGAKQTSNSFGLLNGYVEVRALTHPHAGNFPAIWMMPMDQSDGWPACGEIDIWETIDAKNTAYQTIHSNWSYTLGNKTNPTSSASSTYTMDGEWHTYGLMKTDSLLTWYVDGTEVFSYARLDDEDAAANGQWPFDKEFYLILNQSVGNGSWASAYDSSVTYVTRFDWLRVYQVDTSVTGTRFPRREGAGSFFDLSGRPTASPRRGVYIKGNKKIAVR